MVAVEQFQLLFLDQLGRKLNKRDYALKGGCNLRFYLRSVRFSEDMDFDIRATPGPVLQDRVEQILSGKPFSMILRSRGLAIVRVSAPKQTDTTQRWKIVLAAGGGGLPLRTRIEFSRRGFDAAPGFDSVDPDLIRDYRLTPFLASHYPPPAAFRQKIGALIPRAQTQARDIFDLDHLLRCGVNPRELPPHARWREAQQHALSMPFAVFKSQVLAFLAPERQAQYDDPRVWDEIVLRVVEALKGEEA